MISIITGILSALGKVFPILLKILGPILIPILSILGLSWILRDPVAEMLHTIATIFSILVGSGICFYFVMKGISLFTNSK